MPPLLVEGVKTGIALLAGWATFVAANVAHLAAWIRFRDEIGPFALLTGFPTFGGAPVGIHLFNVAIWALPAALAYGGAMRFLFGRALQWRRLAAVYILGVAAAAVAANLAAWGQISIAVAVNGFHLIYAGVGLLMVRTWVVGTGPDAQGRG